MKLTLKSLSLLALASTALAELPFFEGLTPTFNARLRTESRNQQGLDPSLSTTIRVRPGLQTAEWYGLSAFAETEHTYAIVDDFNSSPGPNEPNDPNNTLIADPETNEINQAYLQYKSNGLTIKAGRQRINLDQQQFIGGVAWRQNEQTYEGVTAVYEQDAFKLTLGYINDVYRIFGSQVPGVLETLEGDGSYIFNLAYKGDGFKAVAYSYLLDFSDQGSWASSDTYGGYVTFDLGGGKFFAEGAYQTEGTDNNPAGEYEDYYGHVSYSKSIAGIKGTVGLIYQGDDFRTPLQTAHKFNGFADALLANQIGLTDVPAFAGGDVDGLADFYISAVKKGLPGGLKAVGALHYFLDEDFSNAYGWEADAVLVKKLSKNTTALVKAAYFFADSDTLLPDDIAQVTLDFNYKF